ncbi:MAG: NUDIX domain-containing protein, partial [Chloroflexi bacterium]|nr:NUDIX domain-containing protein [Chloroflexota bacterium]
EEKRGETAWQAALRELDEETALNVERWFRIDRPETFYNPENDTIYFVPAFAALVAAGAEPTISNEHQAWRWQTAEDAARSVDWAAMRDSILMVGEALADSDPPGLGVTEMYPDELGAD